MSPSGQARRSHPITSWLIAVLIILVPILWDVFGSPTSTSTPIPAATSSNIVFTNTIENIGMKETIAYQCNANHEITYSVINLSPFGGAPPYTIEITPIENSLPLSEKSYIVFPEKPFSYDAGKAFSYIVSSNTVDKQPQISGEIFIPTKSDELCRTQQPVTRILTSIPPPTRTPKIEEDPATPIQVSTTNAPEKTGADTPLVTIPPTTITTATAIITAPSSPRTACDDGKDNDGDNLIDFPSDPQCTDKEDNHEDS